MKLFIVAALIVSSLVMGACTQSPLAPSSTHDIIQPTNNKVGPNGIIWGSEEDKTPKSDTRGIIWGS